MKQDWSNRSASVRSGRTLERNGFENDTSYFSSGENLNVLLAGIGSSNRRNFHLCGGISFGILIMMGVLWEYLLTGVSTIGVSWKLGILVFVLYAAIAILIGATIPVFKTGFRNRLYNIKIRAIDISANATIAATIALIVAWEDLAANLEASLALFSLLLMMISLTSSLIATIFFRILWIREVRIINRVVSTMKTQTSI